MPPTPEHSVDPWWRRPVPRSRWGGRLFVPGLFLLFGNGIAAAAIYGRSLHATSVGTAWLEALAGELAAIVVVSLVPKRLFLVRLQGQTLNLAMAVPMVGGYVVAAAVGLFSALGFIFGGLAAVVYWTTDSRAMRHLARRLAREGSVPESR